MAFRCVVVTPEEQTLDDVIAQAILPAHDGMIGILTGRAPLLLKLGVGPMRIDFTNGQQRTWFVDSGIAQMKDNVLTVLTQEALLPEEIDVDAARAEYEQAQTLKITDQKSLDQRDRALARGRVQQEMGRRQGA
jgi:F-type H+-transporting ATPase subunit epsilon